jgi:hypothetical protein
MNTAAPRNSDRPVRATWQSVMSQDVVSAAKVIVDATSSTPVASFRNPGTRGGSGNPESEALVLASYGGHTRRPCHVARDLSTPGGFRLLPVLEQEVNELAAGVAYPSGASPNRPWLFFTRWGTLVGPAR